MKDKIFAFLKKYKLVFVGIAVGMVGGFAYWYFIGCSSGTCPITGNPYISTLYGALVGGLIFESLNRKNKAE